MDKSKLPQVNDYENSARRSLTFAERRVNRFSIKDTMERLSKKIDESLQDVRYDILHDKVTYDIKTKITDIVTEVQKEAFDFGKQTASSEMKVKVKPTNKKLEGIMYKQNKETIDELLSQIKVRFEQQGYDINNQFSEWWILTRFFNGLKSLFVVGAINLWRETVFESNPELVYALQFSAILDNATTDVCRSLDGKIVKMWSKEYQMIKPPRHWGCRSIMVEILMDDPYKPTLTQRFPVNTWNSPTVENIEERKKKQTNIINNQ